MTSFLLSTLFICTLLLSSLDCFVSSTSGHKTLLGAVVGLLKGSEKGDFDLLIARNKSLLKYMWSNATDAHNPDIVLFYEGNFSADLMKYIQNETPELNIKYVPVQFDGFGIFEDDPATGTKVAKQVYPQCFPTFISKTFKMGYRNMCRFWFIGMFEYLKDYDWMFRLDCDCELLDYITNVMPDNVIGGGSPVSALHHSQHVFVSSPAWQPLHRQKYDKVATTRDGDVVTGMGGFVRDFASRYGLNHSFIDSMYAPYTNAMYINLKWMRSSGTHHHNGTHAHHGQHDSHSNSSVATPGGHHGHGAHNHHQLSQAAIIRQFLKEVDDSNCIYTNRWGDMPLWGAALSLVEHTVRFLNVPYYHASHNVIIKTTSRTGFYRQDIPFMMVWPDNQNSTLNTRISVNG